jgi:hypothetical protein
MDASFTRDWWVMALEPRDLLFLADSAFGFLVSGFGKFICLGGVFHRLAGKLVAGLVVPFVVMHRGDTVGVRGEVMELSCSDMGFSGHGISPE